MNQNLTPSPRSRQSGFSLVELMVGLAAGLTVSVAVVAFTMSSFKSNGEFVQSTRLTQELRNSLGLVTRELRRAGYDQTALGKVATGQGSPFTPMGFGDEITPSTSPKKYRCVIFAYDRGGNQNGFGVKEQNNGEIRGLRLVTATYRGRATGVIEYAVSSSSGKPSCNDTPPTAYNSYPPECTGVWCPLSDPATLNITELAFTDDHNNVGTAPNQVQIRDVNVLISGQLAGSTEFTRSINSKVRIRSDCFLANLANCNVAP